MGDTDVDEFVLMRLRELAAAADYGAGERLSAMFDTLMVHRIVTIGRSLRAELGETVRHGPFAGMHLLAAVADGCYVPKLLGAYETELHGVIRSLPDRGYRHVLNIGCAEGYYAGGLARLLPDVTVAARDIDENARNLCTAMAAQNGVADRVTVGGEVTAADLAAMALDDTFLLCDIEGAERDLLDPVLAPSLLHCDLLVEVHAGVDATIQDVLTARFQATHDVTIIAPADRDPNLYPELSGLGPIDRAVALVERSEDTPWLWLQRR